MIAKSITLFSSATESFAVQSGSVGFLFETSQDGAVYSQYPDAVPLKNLIGDFNEAKEKAFQLARKLLVNEPEHRGIKQLAIFEEIIIRELQYTYHLFRLHEYLVKENFELCSFTGPSRFASDLAWLAEHLKLPLIVCLPKNSGKNSRFESIKRSWQRLRMSGFSHRVVLSELRQVLNRVDPYHRLERLSIRKNQWQDNATWFYTTANTFTRIGLFFEPYFPGKFQYLVENPLTGGEPLQIVDRPWVSLYAFGTQSMEPSATELRAVQKAILLHLNAVSLSEGEGIVLELFLKSNFFQSFLARKLPAGLYASALFERWAKTARPEALVVGNPVFEGYALHAARQRGIPTVLLQHGILGDFCQFWDPPVDHYIVRGVFWQDFLSEEPRSRAEILYPSHGDIENSFLPASREAILFLTAPYGLQEFFHLSDLDDILCVLLSAALKQNRELIIRVHPLEDIGYYRERINKLMQVDECAVRITFSRGEGLDDLLIRTAVAVTYCSTVFLDCLRHHVPLVSFAWHDFSFKQQIEEEGVFWFAKDLEDLRQLIEKSFCQELPAYLLDTKPFLANTQVDVLRDKLAGLIGKNPQKFERCCV